MINNIKVALMITALTGLLMWAGYYLAGSGGLLIALIFSLVTNVGSYWFSDKLVLRMANAQAVTEQEAPELYRLTRELVERANLPMPRLYIVNDPQPNAFATGRSPQNAAVAVNTGLLNLLSREEIQGVVAHELGHVKHRDTLTMTIVATMAATIMMIAHMARFAALFGFGGRDDREGGNPLVLLAMIIVAPLAAMMIQMGVSRAREFEADAMAARLTGSPDGLINALTKLENGASRIPTHSMTPQMAHLAIVNPLRGIGGFSSLFSTHPPMDQRIAALAALRGQVKPVGANPWA